MCVSLCVCVCVRERERESVRERDKQRQTEMEVRTERGNETQKNLMKSKKSLFYTLPILGDTTRMS